MKNYIFIFLTNQQLKHILKKNKRKKMKTIEEKMSLRMLSKDFVVLQRNGGDIQCPIIPPMQIRKTVNVGGANREHVEVTRTSCTSVCSLFKVLDGGKKVSLHCGSGVEHAIQEIVPISEEVKPNNIGGTKMFSLGVKGEA